MASTLAFLGASESEFRATAAKPVMNMILMSGSSSEARRASELDPDIKIMFITGFAVVALNSDSQAPKNAKVLSKPVHLRDLVNEVHKMLAA